MGAEPDGASWTGAPLDGRLAAGAGGGFLAAACAGGDAGGVAATERGAVGDAGAAAVADDGFGAPADGSGVMMLTTGGVDAEVGNSALVGLPVGSDGGSAAIMPGAACGVFQDAA